MVSRSNPKKNPSINMCKEKNLLKTMPDWKLMLVPATSKWANCNFNGFIATHCNTKLDMDIRCRYCKETELLNRHSDAVTVDLCLWNYHCMFRGA